MGPRKTWTKRRKERGWGSRGEQRAQGVVAPPGHLVLQQVPGALSYNRFLVRSVKTDTC